MKFKSKAIEHQYRSGQLHPVLRDVCHMLDMLAQYAAGLADGIEITIVYRPDDKKSYHSKWQAVDISTKDWPGVFRYLTAHIMARVRYTHENIQRAFESKSRNDDGKWYDVPHLHLEYDDGSINSGV